MDGFKLQTKQFSSLSTLPILVKVIAALLEDNKSAIVFLHVDEAQDIKQDEIRRLLHESLHVSTLYGKAVCIIPIITGTNISHLQRGVSASSCSYDTLFLQYLKNEHYQEILLDLFPQIWKSKDNLPKELLMTLEALVGPPRLFLLFLFVCMG